MTTEAEKIKDNSQQNFKQESSLVKNLPSLKQHSADTNSTAEKIKEEITESKTLRKIIDKKRIINKLDKLIAINLLFCSVYDGWKCEKCGWTQGTENKGFEKYYCKHLHNKIERFLMPLNKKVTQELMGFISEDLKGKNGK